MKTKTVLCKSCGNPRVAVYEEVTPGVGRWRILRPVITALAFVLWMLGCAKDPPEIIDVVVIIQPDGGSTNGDANVDTVDATISDFPDGYIDPPERCRPLAYSLDCARKAVDGLPIIHCTDGVDEVYPDCTVFHPETHEAIAYCRRYCGLPDGGPDSLPLR